MTVAVARQRVLGAAVVCAGLGLGVVWAGAAVAAPGPAASRISVERVALVAPAAQVPRLQALGVEVTEDVTQTTATVLARSDQERRALRAAGFAVTTIVRDYGSLRRARRSADLRAARALTSSALPGGRTAYRTPSEVQTELDSLVAGHPGLVRAVVLPQRSIQGRAITGVEIAANVNRADDGRPVYLVMGLHHAREWPSAEIALELARDLVARQADGRVATLLAGLRIVVVPVVNPDAYAYSRGVAPAGQADPLAAVRRRNCRALAGDVGPGCAARRGVDLNRNHGAFWGGLGASTSPADDTYRGAGPWSEPEAAAVHELSRALPITGVQSLHNVAGLILRPPGSRELGRAPDEARLRALGDAMGVATGYASRPGYELYEVTGAAEDWNYIAQGAFSYTIELGGAFPGDPDFQGTYQTHVIDQYLGRAGTPAAGRGVREALLLAAEQAMDARDHVVLRGRAPAGARLRLRKRFDTLTSPRCSDTLTPDACGPTRPALSLPDGLDTALTVGEGASFSWHVGPSTRPFVRARGRRETWTLACERAGAGSASASHASTSTTWPRSAKTVLRTTPAPARSHVSVHVSRRPRARTA